MLNSRPFSLWNGVRKFTSGGGSASRHGSAVMQPFRAVLRVSCAGMVRGCGGHSRWTAQHKARLVGAKLDWLSRTDGFFSYCLTYRKLGSVATL
jgi:hypothetical protein